MLQRPVPTASPGTAAGAPGTRGARFARFAVDYLVPFAVGLVLTLAFHLLLVRNLPTAGTWGAIRAALAERGFIPYVCTMLLFWQMSHLGVRFFVRLLPEFAAMKENLIPVADELAGPEIIEMTRRALMAEANKGRRFLTQRLLLALEHLRMARVNVELGDLLRHSANADRARIEGLRALPTFLFWAIPILGFAGTVGGIGAALGAAPDAGGALGAAFDTLLVAVFMSLAALLVQLLVRHSESRLLADLEDYLNRNLQARIRSESIDSRMQDIVGDAIRKLTYLQESVQKNQGEIMLGNMQTVTGAQKAIQAAMSAMPQLLDNAGKEAANVLAGTVQEQTQVAQQILTNLDNAGVKAANVLAGAVQEQTQAASQILANLDNAGVKAANVLTGAVQEQTQAASQILANLDAKATDIAQALGAEFGRVTSELASALKEVTGRLAESFQSARELTAIQASLEKNLEELNKIHDLGQSFADMKETLAALKPVLASLNKPIPLKFTLEPTDLGMGGAPGVGGGGVVIG